MAEYYNKLPFVADKDEGSIFVSYAHKDRESVFPIIKRLYENGWPIWYDEGIEPGENWKAALNYRIGRCSVYLLFVSKNSLKSVDTIDHEFIVARNFQKQMIMCIIDEVDFFNDFASINYAAASREKYPRTTPEELENELMKVPALKKGEPREAQGISLSAPEFIDQENKQYLYEYEFCDDGVALTGFNGTRFPNRIVVPREYPVGSGYPVVELRGTFNHSFDGHSPGKLIIPDTVKRIRKGTFYGYALPQCISVPPSVELIEELNFSLDDKSGYEIDLYDRQMKIEYAPETNTDTLIRRVSRGMSINYVQDKSMSYEYSENKLYEPKGNYVFISFQREKEPEYKDIITLLREQDCNIVTFSDIPETKINTYIRKCGCFIAFENEDYYKSDDCEQLYSALAFNKNIALINTTTSFSVSLPDDLHLYLWLKQRLKLDDPDLIMRLTRWISSNGCRMFKGMKQGRG